MNDSPDENRLGIVADDLTGAMDVGAVFANQGIPVMICLSRKIPTLGQAKIIVLTTDTRNASPGTAAGQMRAACAWLAQQRIPIFYKKIDSTMQGPIAAELRELSKLMPEKSIVVCPANPAQGRIVVRGALMIKGRLSQLLGDLFGSKRSVCLLRIKQPFSVKKTVLFSRENHRMILADATTMRHLNLLARHLVDYRGILLAVGSSGLASAMAKLMKCPDQLLSDLSPKAVRPMILFSGSRNPVTQRQHAWLGRKLRASVVSLFSPKVYEETEAAIRGGRPIVIALPVHQEANDRIVHRLRPFNKLFHQERVGSVLAIGGDTACLVARWLRLESIWLQREIVPGLAWGVMRGGLADGLPLCTKPGGFGTASALETAVKFFTPSIS